MILLGKEKAKVYLYTRVSTSMQIDGYSLDAQKSRMKAFCEFNEYEIVGEYEDAGKSGKSIEGRVAFNNMMEDIKSGKDDVSFVLVFKLYDKIEETENALVEAKAKKRSILAEKVCGDNIYKALIFFDKMYESMNEAERREFLTQFIEKVEIYEEEQENGQWLKSIEFKLPIISKDMKISLDNGSQIETGQWFANRDRLSTNTFL